MEKIVLKQLNSMPFTKRLHYHVEEISIEEFMMAIRDLTKTDKNRIYLQILESKINLITG